MWIYKTKLKFLKTSNKVTLDELYMQNHILMANNLFKMSAGKFMHSCENNQLPSHFNQCFKSIQTVHKYPNRLATSKKFLSRVNLSQGQFSLKFIGPKVWSEMPDQISFNLTLISNICTNITYTLGLLVQSNKWN